MFGCGFGGGENANDKVRSVRRGIADFCLALFLFWGAALAVNGSDIRAHAVPLLPAKQAIVPGGSVPAGTIVRASSPDEVFYDFGTAPASRPLDLLLLSFAFAALLAGNLAFWRHLRRVYASPRRSVWRRG